MGPSTLRRVSGDLLLELFGLSHAGLEYDEGHDLLAPRSSSGWPMTGPDLASRDRCGLRPRHQQTAADVAESSYIWRCNFHLDEGSKYHVLLKWEPDDEVYTIWDPSLPGCVTFGRTVDEALEMIEDAIGGYVETLRAHGEDIPTDDDVLGRIVEIVAHA